MGSPYIRCPAPSLAEEALRLEWAFGLNSDYKAGIHNLSSSSGGGGGAGTSRSRQQQFQSQSQQPQQQRRVFYTLAHTGILYDAVHNTQQHLLGHRYSIISSSCCSHNHRFIVTADEGDVEVRRRIQQQVVLSQSTKGGYAGDAAHDVEEEELMEEAAMFVDPTVARSEEEEDGSAMIVWDAATALPLKVIATGKYGGVLSVAMSPDGQYIAALNRRDPQEIMIWAWTQANPAAATAASAAVDVFADVDVAPVFVRRIAARDEQTSISFSQDHPELLCTNGLRRVIFWSWVEGVLKYYSPPILQRRLKASVGNFTQTVYVPGTKLACSGTVDGDVVLWSLQPQDRVIKEQDKSLLKMVRVHTGGVTFVTTVRGYIVTGGMDGVVKFLDAKLRLVAWFDGFNGGPIISISFDRVPPVISVEEARASAPEDVDGHLLTDGTAAADMFAAPDFMVSTAHSMIIDVPAKSFHTPDAAGRAGPNAVSRGRLIVQGQDRPVHCLAAHPRLPRLAIGGYSGNLHLWDYCEKRLVLLSLFRNLLIRCMRFDPAGKRLVVGFTNGVIKVLDADTLEAEQTIRPASSTSSGPGDETANAAAATATTGQPASSSSAIGKSKQSVAEQQQQQSVVRKPAASVEEICFSPDGLFMATATDDGAVGLYERVNTTGAAAKKGVEWQLVGHHKTHRAAICGLHFGAHAINGMEQGLRLLSVGADKRLIEYDLVDSSPETGLLLRTAHKLSQESTPTGFTWLPGGCSLLDAASQPRDFFESNDNNHNDDDDDCGSGGGGAHGKSSGRSAGAGGAAAAGGEAHDVLDALLVATREYKFQVYLSNWSRQCVKTVLAPTFGGPVTRMAVVPVAPPSKAATASTTVAPPSHCLVYATKEKVVGLAQLPLRGDPCGSIGLLAHPGAITSMVTSYDGAFAFTAGGADQGVMQWRIRGDCIVSPSEWAAVVQCRERGGVPLPHLVGAVEGGADGELMKEVVDYFYYAQIRAQGEETTAKRVLLGAIPFAQMPNLLRSLCYYPSEQEIGHLTYEVANMYSPRDEPLAEVDVDAILLDFSQFMRLYINYRPVFGITRQDIEAAFAALGADRVSGEINRDLLFQKLSTKGEPLKSNEVAAALTSLLGDGIRLDMLEDVITARTFAENLLGFEDYEEGMGVDGKERRGNNTDGELDYDSGSDMYAPGGVEDVHAFA
ncbi:WD domain, G-beta repeat [Novymonas esmeraldas]|uniref:Cilia- and flagella-associated protein 251 n=1 Tax=Novymonas esmeraldas TaxID=1808958 RepID=A0AAW0EMW3_9TRYP